MSKIYRTTDIIQLRIDNLKVGISPLSFEQKMEIQAQMLTGKTTDAMKAAALAVKYSLKQIDGLKTADDQNYELEFENGKISDKCWDDLQNLTQGPKLTTVCLNLLNAIPDEFIDPGTGKKIDGVSRINKEKSPAKK